MKMIDRVLVMAAVHPDGGGTASEIAELLGTTKNSVKVQASWMRDTGLIGKADGHGTITPTVKGYRRAMRLLSKPEVHAG